MTTPHNNSLAASFNLTGRTAVIIGGSGVLGSEIAAALADAGATTVIVGRSADKCAEVKAELVAGAAGGVERKVETAVCDVAERASLVALAQRVEDEFGGTDVLVNGAGVNSATPLLDIDDEEMQRIVDINQLAVLRACQEFGRHMVARAEADGTGASIINIGSASGLTPLSRVFTYSMTKAAVHNLTKNIAREWGPLGIRCNVLVPGFFPAEQNRKILSPDRVESILNHTPMGRFGDAHELGGAVALLASDAGTFITGSEIVVDGGFHAQTI